MRSGWQWRSVHAQSDDHSFIFLVQVHLQKDDWKAWLIKKYDTGPGSIVSRLEHHGDHPGLHVHSHCGKAGVEPGPSVMDQLARIPVAGDPHRRIGKWEKSEFFEFALAFYRIGTRSGSLS
jgi:hypothetical protein